MSIPSPLPETDTERYLAQGVQAVHFPVHTLVGFRTIVIPRGARVLIPIGGDDQEAWYIKPDGSQERVSIHVSDLATVAPHEAQHEISGRDAYANDAVIQVCPVSKGTWTVHALYKTRQKRITGLRDHFDVVGGVQDAQDWLDEQAAR